MAITKRGTAASMKFNNTGLIKLTGGDVQEVLEQVDDEINSLQNSVELVTDEVGLLNPYAAGTLVYYNVEW